MKIPSRMPLETVFCTKLGMTSRFINKGDIFVVNEIEWVDRKIVITLHRYENEVIKRMWEKKHNKDRDMLYDGLVKERRKGRKSV